MTVILQFNENNMTVLSVGCFDLELIAEYGLTPRFEQV